VQEVYCQRQSSQSCFVYASLSCIRQQPLEIFVDDEIKLTLHGLQQHYVKLEEIQKNRKLNELLDKLEFDQVCTCCHIYHGRRSHSCHQVVIFVKSVARVIELDKMQFSQYQHPLWSSAGGAVRILFYLSPEVLLIDCGQHQPIHRP
jgi:hypothetical protein